VDFQMNQGSPATTTAALVGPTGERVELSAQIAVIGRHAECDITLSDSNVSRRHAEIHKDPSGWILKDLGSTNGTSVNGTKISSPRYLSDGDIISVAGNHVRFEIS
jgi:pSer/pThr/pTyr-binding forkhead associated (FHA) protein